MRSWEMLWTHCCCRTVAVLQRCCNVSQSPSQRHRNARCTHQDQSYIHTTIATRGTPCLRTSSSDSANLCETNYHPPHRYPPRHPTSIFKTPPIWTKVPSIERAPQDQSNHTNLESIKPIPATQNASETFQKRHFTTLSINKGNPADKITLHAA